MVWMQWFYLGLWMFSLGAMLDRWGEQRKPHRHPRYGCYDLMNMLITLLLIYLLGGFSHIVKFPWA